MALKRVIGIAVVVSALAAISYGVVLFVDSLTTPEELEESLAPAHSPPVTIAVEQRVIRTSITGRGLVAYESTVTVSLPTLPGLDGSMPVLTRLPLQSAALDAGDVLVEVAYRPVILLPGESPLVRDLAKGDRGPDVAMLQRALVEIGLLEAADIDGVFGAVTIEAVTAVYDRAGYPPPESAGTVYAPVAELYVASVLPVVLRQPLAQVGDGLSPGSDLLTVSKPEAHLVVGLPSFEAGLLTGGEAATIVDDAAGRTMSGQVVRIGAVPDPEVGGVPIIVAFDGDLPDDRDYRITIEVETTGSPVLTVPETAIYLGSGDSPYVLRLSDDGSAEPVSVTIGLVGSDGYAQITPADGDRLRVDDRVVVGADT